MADPASALTVDGWSELAPASPQVPGSGRLLRHDRIPDAFVHLGREDLGSLDLDAEAYADRQVAELGRAARVLDRCRLGEDARRVRLELRPRGRSVTTDLLVRVRDGVAELCAVSRPTERGLELLEDVARVVRVWSDA